MNYKKKMSYLFYLFVFLNENNTSFLTYLEKALIILILSNSVEPTKQKGIHILSIHLNASLKFLK